jgi:dihydrodipicolinate synthase/N-acetylneuraminate lyase
MLGVNSCVSGVALTCPKLIIKIYESMINKKIDVALHLYQKVMKVRAILGEKGGRAVTAYDVLNKKGVNVGTCKAPWQRLSQDDAIWVFKELEKTGVYDGKFFEGYKFDTSNRF